MSEMSITRRIAQHALSEHELTEELDSWMRLLLSDYAAVTAGGVGKESARSVRKAVALSPERDELRSSGVLGFHAWATLEDAALVNGTTAHGLELDDTFEQGSSHPGVVIFPALLAVADREGQSLGDVLTAATVGYDVMCGVGVLLGAAESYGRGFHPTAVTGVVGAAAAVARLWGADEDQLTHAVSIAANLAAGSLEFLGDGSWTKRLNAGHAAASGIRAARMAMNGFDAPETAFEGRNGFLRQYGQGEVEGRRLTLEFGRFALETSIKFYPCCRYMHGSIDLLSEIAAERPELQPSEVSSIDVGVIKAGQTLVSEPPERKLVVNTPVDAQFSMPFGAAVALSSGQATVSQFDRATEVARDVQAWMEKVHCHTSERLEQAFPDEWHAEVKLTFADGTVVERYSEAFVGSARKRATWEQIENKADGLIGSERSAALVRAVREATLETPVRDVVSAVSAGSTIS